MFQADTIICANSELRVDDFLEYDFIGAPIDLRLEDGEGFNGGFSLRNRSMMLDIATNHSWLSDRNKADIRWTRSEDRWFYRKMGELPLRLDGTLGAHLPDVEVARTFSVESMWHESPLSYHRVEEWHADRMDRVDEWCPEHKLSTSELLVREGYVRD